MCILFQEDCPAGYKPLSAVLGGNLLPGSLRICYKTRPVGPKAAAYTAGNVLVSAFDRLLPFLLFLYRTT